MNVVILSSEKINEIKIRDRYNIVRERMLFSLPGEAVFLARQININAQDMLKQIFTSKKKTKRSMWECIRQLDK